jgi:hypothetical protein
MQEPPNERLQRLVREAFTGMARSVERLAEATARAERPKKEQRDRMQRVRDLLNDEQRSGEDQSPG